MSEPTIKVEIPANQMAAFKRLILSDDWTDGYVPFVELMRMGLYRRLAVERDNEERIRLQGDIRRASIFLDFKNSIIQESEKQGDE